MIGDISVVGFLSRYLVVVHVLGCLTVLSLMISLLIRPNNQTKKIEYGIYIGILLFCFLQLFVAYIRISVTFNSTYTLNVPINAFVDFIWSPMGTILLIWFFIRHITIMNTEHFSIAYPKTLLTRININAILTTLFFGVLTGYSVNKLFIDSHTLEPDIVMVLFGLLTFIGILYETIGSILFFKRLNITVYSWFFCFGTWMSYLYLL